MRDFPSSQKRSMLSACTSILPLQHPRPTADAHVGIEQFVEPCSLAIPGEIQVLAFASYYQAEPDAMLVAWLSDRLVAELKEEKLAVDALKVAEAKVQFERRSPGPNTNLLEMIRDFLQRDGRVLKAWLFGSVARGEGSADSDVDLMVRHSERATTGTLLDYADLTFHLENLIHRRVDLVEEGYVKAFAVNHIDRDKILIYG
jgi:predicted nucleotidyltransferase